MTAALAVFVGFVPLLAVCWLAVWGERYREGGRR